MFTNEEQKYVKIKYIYKDKIYKMHIPSFAFSSSSIPAPLIFLELLIRVLSGTPLIFHSFGHTFPAQDKDDFER